MLIKTRKSYSLPDSKVTDEQVFLNRRQILKQMGFIGAGSLLAGQASAAGLLDFFNKDDDSATNAANQHALTYRTSDYKVDETMTSEAKVIGHNNFYEFGTGKADPKAYSQDFQFDPWTLRVSGLTNKPLQLDYDDLFGYDLEERVYRLRCVEAWSMVIPWVGFPLASLLKQADPMGDAKYVAFETLKDSKQMPGQRGSFSSIPYPYVEGLRMDEAMHPLTFLAVGVYGKSLPPQNGAPIRLVVPWKYGFKSIKSIVKISLVDKEPPTTWNIVAPNEYGFYANVNPNVDHPRWSQASERRITSGGLGSDERIPTLMFNGYADEVASLYTGMDLRKNY